MDVTTELAVQQITLPRQPSTPMDLLAMALNQDASMDKLEKFMDLQERWEAKQARVEYNKQMAFVKAEAPEIIKNTHVKIRENYEYDHASLDAVCDAVIPVLAKYGFNHRWIPDQKDGLIYLTCVVTHVSDHSESATLFAAPDNSGGKNAVQAVCSTVTYLERYTLLAILGFAAKGTDKDGRVQPKAPEQAPPPSNRRVLTNLHEYIEEIQRCETKDGLRSAFKTAYTSAKAVGDELAVKSITDAYESQKGEVS